jgi:hypothetical protein
MEQVTVSRRLTNISIGFSNAPFISEDVMTVQEVNGKTGEFYRYGKEVFTPEYDVREPYSRAREIRHEYSKDDYRAIPHALSEPVSWDERDEARDAGIPLDPYADATELVTGKLALSRELDVSSLLRATSTYAAGNSVTLTATQQWSDYTNSKPLDDVRVVRITMRPKIGKKPNVAIVPDAVFQIVRYHPQVLQRLGKDVQGGATEDQLKELFEVDEIFVPEAVYNPNPAGQAETFADVWGKDVEFLYRERVARRRQITFGKIFRVKYSSGNYDTRDREVRTWQEADRKVDMVEGEFMEARKIIAPEAGYVIKAAVA